MPMDFKQLIAQMTMEEKVGQLTQFPAICYTEHKSEITGPVEGLDITVEDLNRSGSLLGVRCAADVIDIQDHHMQTDRNRIPLMFMRDIIHGCRTIYPIPLAMAGSFDPVLMEECARMAAVEASAGGTHVNFSPMVDYVRDARWGRVMESHGEDPYLSGVMGAASVRGYRGDGDLSKDGNIAACVKHFAAYGGAEAGRDYNTVELSEHLLREYYLPAYKSCFDAGADMVMPSFNNLNGLPSTVNPWLMKQILRDEWKFDGLVITDYNAVLELLEHGIAASMKDAAELAFRNGVDIEMVSSGFAKNLKTLIEEGKITEQALDNVVEKLLRFKEKLGLFDNPYGGASPEREAELLLCDKHREIARRAAEETAVLLKNDGTLPFSENVQKIAVIGPYAESGEFLGNWRASGDVNETVTVAAGIRALLPHADVQTACGCGMNIEDTDTAGFAEALCLAKDADIVVLCLGEPPFYSGESHSRTTLTLPGMQSELMKEVVAVNPNTAVLLFSGRPLVLTEVNAVAPAVLQMWMPGTEGGHAAANLLFGKRNPCGKLAMTFPQTVGQCPIYYSYTNTGRPKTVADDMHQPCATSYIDCGNKPLYFFGQGLSYTTFSYDAMTLNRRSMCTDDTLTVTVQVTNGGSYEGKETVQLYLHDKIASAVHPVQKLIAFEKINLKPGETKTVSFDITEPMLRFWNFENQFISEPGEFEVMVGYADHMQFTETFILE